MRLDSVDPAPAFVPLRADQTPAGVVVEKERLVVGLHPAIALRAVGQIGRHLRGGRAAHVLQRGHAIIAFEQHDFVARSEVSAARPGSKRGQTASAEKKGEYEIAVQVPVSSRGTLRL
jgi:hypothetical protein